MVDSSPHSVQDRRGADSGARWQLVVDRQTGGVFYATNQIDGRSYRLPVSTVDEAKAQIRMLNDTTLEIIV
ncbi:MAG: hypothetical protein ACLP01_04925 [Solirubrobacteraceae bacterium]